MNRQMVLTKGAARAKWRLEQRLTGSADIYAFSLASDSRGGEALSWSVIVSGTPCHIEPYKRKPSETDNEDTRHIESENEFIGHFKRGITIRPRDRVVSGGVTYEITGVDTSSTLGPIVWAYLYRLQ